MPVKLIGTIILIVIVAILTGFNLENKCTIWCFHNFENIPVFGALLASFVAGVIVTLPFTFRRRFRKDAEVKEKKPKKEKKSLLKKKDAGEEVAEPVVVGDQD